MISFGNSRGTGNLACKWLNWVQVPLLLCLIGIAYRPVLYADFVWDDFRYVVKNTSLRSFGYWRLYFTDPRETFANYSPHFQTAWRPVRNLSYAVDYRLFGLNPLGWHLHNVVLHGVASVLLLFLLRYLFFVSGREGKDKIAGGLACLTGCAWWSLHPIQTEVVCWVKSRDDLLAVVLSLVSMHLFFRVPGADFKKMWMLVCAGTCAYIAALLSKENSVVVPAVVLLYFWFVNPGQFSRLFESRVYVYLLVVLSGISIAFLAFRDILLRGTAQGSYIAGSFGAMMKVMALAWTKYLALMAWPLPPTQLLADYDGWPHVLSVALPDVVLGAVLVAVPTIMAVVARKMYPLIAFGWLAFVILMLPFANIVPMMQVLAERFVYMPSLGIAIIVTGICFAGLNALGESEKRIVLVSICLIGMLAVAETVATSRRVQVWHNERTLFADNLKKNPDSWRTATNYLDALMQAEETTAALVLARESLKKFPGDLDVQRSAGIAFLKAGKEPEGEKMLLDVYSKNPDDRRALEILEIWNRMKKDPVKSDKIRGVRLP